jgi:hypothetical protein
MVSRTALHARERARKLRFFPRSPAHATVMDQHPQQGTTLPAIDCYRFSQISGGVFPRSTPRSSPPFLRDLSPLPGLNSRLTQKRVREPAAHAAPRSPPPVPAWQIPTTRPQLTHELKEPEDVPAAWHRVGMSPYQRLTSLARRQHGALSVRQARDTGLSAKQIDGLVARGRLERPLRGALVIAGSPPSWEQTIMTSLHSAGTAALASHSTAAFLWSLIGRRPGTIEVVMPRWDRSIQPFIVHESTDLLPRDRSLVGPIPATTPARTVVDLGATAPGLVEFALETGIRNRLFTLAEVAAFMRRVARRGRRGVGVIRPLVEARFEWDRITESALEDLFLRTWAASGLPAPFAQHTIRDEAGRAVCRADFAFPDRRLRIELDSEAYHMDRLTFRRDREVQNRTEVLGWRTLRYTWWNLMSDPACVISEIVTALEAPGLETPAPEDHHLVRA